MSGLENEGVASFATNADANSIALCPQCSRKYSIRKIVYGDPADNQARDLDFSIYMLASPDDYSRTPQLRCLECSWEGSLKEVGLTSPLEKKYSSVPANWETMTEEEQVSWARDFLLGTGLFHE
jgi:hypothetical protein